MSRELHDSGAGRGHEANDEDRGQDGMRVMSYNLLNGGHDTSGSGDARWRAQLEIINEVAPEVLLVQEARGFDATR